MDDEKKLFLEKRHIGSPPFTLFLSIIYKSSLDLYIYLYVNYSSKSNKINLALFSNIYIVKDRVLSSEIYLSLRYISEEFLKTEQQKTGIQRTLSYISVEFLSESFFSSEIYLCVSNISDEFSKTVCAIFGIFMTLTYISNEKLVKVLFHRKYC